MAYELPEKAQQTLEGLTRIAEDENGFQFMGIDMMRVGYAAEVKKSDCPYVRDDPYSVEKGKCNSVSETKIPKGATHYSLGPVRSEEYVSRGKNKYGSYTDYVPIAFLKKA